MWKKWSKKQKKLVKEDKGFKSPKPTIYTKPPKEYTRKGKKELK